MVGDPIGSQRVTASGIAYMTRVLVELAQELCQGKVLFTLEGGYSIKNMQQEVWAVLSELRGAPLAADHPDWLSPADLQRFRTSTAESAAIDQAKQWVNNWWPL